MNLLLKQRRFERLCEQVRSRLTATGLTSEDILATIPEARNRVYARHYGKTPVEDIARGLAVPPSFAKNANEWGNAPGSNTTLNCCVKGSSALDLLASTF